MKTLTLFVTMLLLSASFAYGEDECDVAHGDTVAQEYGPWSCILIDGCNKEHKGEALCKSHAAGNARKACLLNSDEPETCDIDKVKCTR